MKHLKQGLPVQEGAHVRQSKARTTSTHREPHVACDAAHHTRVEALATRDLGAVDVGGLVCLHHPFGHLCAHHSAAMQVLIGLRLRVGGCERPVASKLCSCACFCVRVHVRA